MALRQEKQVAKVKTIGLILWPMIIALTIVYWAEIRSASWQWHIAIGIIYIFLLSTLHSSADQRAEEDSTCRGVRTLISDKKYSEALKAADLALAKLPGNAFLLYAKGECHQKLGQIREAEQAYLRVLKTEPSHAYAANNLATLYMNNGDYLKAAEYYGIAQKAGASGDWFDRNIERIWKKLMNKGVKIAETGELLEASKYYVLAKKFGASGYVFNNNRHLLKNQLITKGKVIQDTNVELALKYAEAMVSLISESEPGFAIAYAWRGMLLYELARYSEALSDLNRCREIDPSYRSASIDRKIQDTQRALAESQNFSVSLQLDSLGDKQLADEQTHWKVGQSVFDYYQVKKIIEGGMGEIYICWNHMERMPLVLKAIALKKLGDLYKVKRKNISRIQLFRREAEIWFRLGQHPNIVRLYCVNDFEHRHIVLSMEYIAGEPGIGPTLRDHLNPKDRKALSVRKGLPVKDTIQIGLGICNAMQFAYDKLRLVHRDLKPENIFLTETGEIKVGDFGLAVREGSKATRSGTKHYIAPELSNLDYDDTYRPHTTNDIYATGIILFEMLTGNRPFDIADGTTISKDNLANWIRKHQTVKPPQLIEVNQKIHAELNRIVMKCLSKKPEKRFQSFHELQQALIKYAKVDKLEIEPSSVATKVPETDKYEYTNLYREAISLDTLGYHEESLSKYSQLLQNEPFKSKTSVGWCNMGKVLATLQRYTKALQCYEKAIAIDSKDTHALFGKANTLAFLRKYEEALQGIQDLLAVDPEYTDAYQCKGYILLHTGKIEEARIAYQKALDRHPTKEAPFALNGLGLCAKKEHLFREALDYLDKAIASKNDYAEAYSNRCEVLRLLGRYDEALESGQEAIELEPMNSGHKMCLAMVYGCTGQFSKAALLFEKAVELSPKNDFAWLGLANCYAELRRIPEAIQCAKRAIRLGCAEAQNLLYNLEQEYIR